jgi:glycosyltransferase involved in cell wall biosynthesis
MQMVRTALWLRNHGMASSVLATDDLKGKLAEMFRVNGFEVIHCPLQGKGYMRKAVKTLLQTVKSHHITHLQAHMFRESMVCRYVKLFNSGVINVFRIETYIDCSAISSVKKNFYHFLALITQDLVDYYLPNGHLVNMELQKRSHVSSGNIKVVFNGVEPFGEPDFSPVSRSEDGFIDCVMVANLIRGKGHELLFEALARLKSYGLHLRVSLYGDDLEPARPGITRYSDELKSMVEQLGVTDRVLFKGFTSDLRRELEPFTILLLPSHSEGTPNTVLEAMSVRKLVIVSDAGELSYMVHHLNSGLVHKVGDVDGLVGCLKMLFVNDTSMLEVIRENGYQRWKSDFSLDRVMSETATIFN